MLTISPDVLLRVKFLNDLHRDRSACMLFISGLPSAVRVKGDRTPADSRTERTDNGCEVDPADVDVRAQPYVARIVGDYLIGLLEIEEEARDENGSHTKKKT